MNSPFFLIVEDHPEVADNNKLYLEKIEPSAHCIISQTPAQAGNLLDLETLKLIVMDLYFTTTNGESSSKLGLYLLATILDKYPNLNVLVYTGNPFPLVSLKGITNHQGGFTVANKNKPRKDFIAHAVSALKGELHLSQELLKQIKERNCWCSQKIELLHLACEECLSDWAIAQRIHCHENSVRNSFKQIRTLMQIEADYEYVSGNEKKKKLNNERVAMCMEAKRRHLI